MAGNVQSSASPDPGEQPSLTRFVISILPLCDSQKLLERLAEFWSRHTAARTAIVLDSTRQGRGVAGYAVTGRNPEILECALPSEIEPSPENFWDQLRRAFPRQTDVGEGSRRFPLVIGSQKVGMVVTSEFSEFPDATARSRLQELVDLSACLLAQAAALEAASAAARNSVDPDELETAKLSALAEFAAGAGHEINNPVATIAGRAQLLLAGEHNPERRQSLLTIGGQAHRIRDMIGDIMLFARPPEPQCTMDDLSRIAKETVKGFEPECTSRGCRISLTAPQSVQVWGDPLQLAVAIGCLIQNALDASSTGGRINVSTETAFQDGQTWGRLSVNDDGPGFSPQDREHLFDPFYSGRQAGRGLGFGLAKCWRIVSMHRGHIEAKSTVGATSFELWLPSGPPTRSR